MKNYSKITIIIFLSIVLFNYTTTVKINAAQNSLAERLKGRLLLQVQYQGQIWYVDTNSLKRYLVTTENAVDIFRALALGITNANLDKIPTDINSLAENQDSDNDGYLDKTEAQFGYNLFSSGKAEFDKKLIDRLQGKLLLQVEDSGRVWYMNPLNGKKYEVKKESVLSLCRNLSLGITNNDLNEISSGYIKTEDDKLTSNQTVEGVPTTTSNPARTSNTSPINNSSASNIISSTAQAISNGSNSTALSYFTSNMQPSIKYTLNVLDSYGRGLFADILIDANISSDKPEQKIYTTILPFNNSYGKINITLEKQTDGKWLISNL